MSRDVEGHINQLVDPVDLSDRRGGYDRERLLACEKARSVEERLQNIEERLRDKVETFNHTVGDEHTAVRYVFRYTLVVSPNTLCCCCCIPFATHRSLTNILDHHIEFMNTLDTQIEQVKKQAADTSELISGVRHQL